MDEPTKLKLQRLFVSALQEERILQADMSANVYAVMVVNEDEYLGQEEGLPELFNMIDVYLVNDTVLSFPTVKVLTGAFASDDDNLLETSKALQPAVELPPRAAIKIGRSDTGELDFVVWYDIDMVEVSNYKFQFRFSLLKYRWNYEEEHIPLLGISGYKIGLAEREGESVDEWVTTHDMKSRYLDYGNKVSFTSFESH